MPTQMRITVNREGIGQIAKGGELRAELLRRAQRVAAVAAGPASTHRPDLPQPEASGYVGRNRARASVMWRGGLAPEIHHRVLGGAIDAARG